MPRGAPAPDSAGAAIRYGTDVIAAGQDGDSPFIDLRVDSGETHRIDDLDLLLVMVAKPRLVRRDGVHFQGLRFMSPILAPYVGESVTIRYDPRDLGEIRVFHKNRFLCRAISPEYAHETITLKDIQTARAAQRRALRQQINERVGVVAEYFPEGTARRKTETAPRPQRKSKLRTYQSDD